MMSVSETGMSHSSPDMASFSQMPGPPRSRTQSISSDRPSTMSQSIMSPPLSVSPEAAFIATSAASQIVTNDHDSHTDTWYDQHGFQPSGEAVTISNAALRHLNNFLDHLLFNFLASSGSTALLTLRPAVIEILKPKLAKDAINNADEELREYLGGGDDDEFLQPPSHTSPRDWDLELAWKRTRLRCMVYSSLGDMEEEDEDHYMEEGLLGDDDESSSSHVSPAVAIFLTSILEFLGEQALISAGQAAWNRTRVKYEKDNKAAEKGRSDVVDSIIIEEVDMERVALDRTLGRLWRAWKKRVRSRNGSIDLLNRPVSREKMYHMRLGSLSPRDGPMPPAVEESTSEREQDGEQKDASLAELGDDERAAAIPLPMNDRDVDEIEVPGLAHYSDIETEEEEPEELDLGVRPKSLVIFPFARKAELPTPTASQPHTPTVTRRKRSNSLPTPAVSPYGSARALVKNDSTASQNTETMQGTDQHLLEKTLIPDQSPAEAAQVTSGAIPEIHAAVASEKQAEDDDEEGESDYEEIEQAQILTSARISIGGSVSNRSISPANSDKSSRPPLSIQTLTRSGSLRVVDVSSPRTPSSRSQRSSYLQEQGNSSYSRSGNASRASSTHTQPNLEEHRESEDYRGLRASSTSSSNRSRNSIGHAISEAEETTGSSGQVPASAIYTPVATVPSRKEIPTVPEDAVMQTESDPMVQEQKVSHRQVVHPIFGSVRRQTPPSPQRSPTMMDPEQRQQRSPRTKVAAFNTPPDSGAYVEDDVGPLPQMYARHSPRQFGSGTSFTAPSVPEKSSGRYNHVQSQGAGFAPGPIATASTDRTTNGEGVQPSMDQSVIRSKHTPASSISSHKMRAARGSQDSTATRPEDVARNFEELIQSNETIQYTLTPESMRGLDGSPNSTQSSIAGKDRKSEDSRKNGRDRTGSISVVKQVELRRSTSVTRSTGLRSHPVELAMDMGRPPVSMSNRVRGAVPQAREARVPRESIVEFAEFIRATGPAGAEAPPVTGLRRNPSLMRDPSTTPLVPAPKTSVDQGPRPSMGGSVSRARLQARDATVDSGNDNSDLIDFIRRGPPNSGNPRIPRTVAPFRTTMDSDQLTAAVGGKAMDASLPDIQDMRDGQGSANVTEMSAPSIQSSVNSQSALLGRKQGATQNSSPFDEPEMMPVRKQRRVRDPYALDFSDEEDDDLDMMHPAPSRRPQQKEESLIDFLNNAPPPPSSDPVPLNLPRTQTMPVQPTHAPKKKASSTSLMSRFRQNSTASASNGMRGPTSSRSLSSRAGPPPAAPASKGYIPIQVNIPTGGDLYPSYPSYNSPSTTPAVPAVPSNFASRPSGRVPMKKFEPRDAASVPSTRGTSDLAEFLRSSEPPPSLNPTPYAAEPTGSSGSRLFGRRKKSTAFA